MTMHEGVEIVCEGGAVATGPAEAARAGAAILTQGGNAFDAAAAFTSGSGVGALAAGLAAVLGFAAAFGLAGAFAAAGLAVVFLGVVAMRDDPLFSWS